MATSHKFNQFLVQYATIAGDMQAAKMFLLANAPKMTMAEKIEADLAVVNAVSTKYGIEASESKRPMFSGWTFKAGKDCDKGYHDAVNCANVAMHRARAILQGKAKKNAEPVNKAQRAYESLAKLIEDGDAEAIRKVKALMLLVKAM